MISASATCAHNYALVMRLLCCRKILTACIAQIVWLGRLIIQLLRGSLHSHALRVKLLHLPIVPHATFPLIFPLGTITKHLWQVACCNIISESVTSAAALSG